MCAAHKLILLDEPVSGLDPVATRSLYAQIAHINEATGLTVIMVSHDIDASLRYASHILHLGQEGQLFFGTQKEYLRSAVYHEFLGDSAAPMWKHDFPNRIGRAAPREEVEPTETEKQVRIHSGKKSSRRIRTEKADAAKEEKERKDAKRPAGTDTNTAVAEPREAEKPTGTDNPAEEPRKTEKPTGTDTNTAVAEPREAEKPAAAEQKKED